MNALDSNAQETNNAANEHGKKNTISVEYFCFLPGVYRKSLVSLLLLLLLTLQRAPDAVPYLLSPFSAFPQSTGGSIECFLRCSAVHCGMCIFMALRVHKEFGYTDWRKKWYIKWSSVDLLYMPFIVFFYYSIICHCLSYKLQELLSFYLIGYFFPIYWLIVSRLMAGCFVLFYL